MVRGIFYYLVIWCVVTAVVYGYGRLTRRERSNLLRSLLFGLGTATVAMAIVLLIVYLF
jgi:hypothetical protein